MNQTQSLAYSSPYCLYLLDLKESLAGMASDMNKANLIKMETEIKEFLQLLINYNPYKEDVYSMGLIILQTMLLCSQKEIQDIRESKQLLVTVIIEKFLDQGRNHQ